MLEELIIRALCDNLPNEAVDAIFLFGQTSDNQASVIEKAVELLKDQKARKVMFIGTGPMSGYPGFEVYKDALLERGVLEADIDLVEVPEGTDQLNTLIEAEAMASHALKLGYTQLLAIASPFQQPRAFMAAVTAANHIYPTLKLYSVPGKVLPWQEEVKHSQGKLTGTRAELIADEMLRIAKYNAKGDLAKSEEVLEYLNKRETSLRKTQ